MIVTVVLGGNKPSKALLHKCVKESSLIIAADSGAKILFEENINIDILLGDFDSLDESYKKYLTTSKIKTYKKEKDFTDGHAAMLEAVKGNPSKIYLLGATGTRIDHFLANLNLLKIASDNGIRAELLDDNNKCYIITKSTEIRKEDGYISFSAFTKDVLNFTLKGLKYPLQNHTLKFAQTLTVSNEFIEDTASITFESGDVLVMHTKD